ncbi:MAG: hypothetical protein ACOX7P_04825 [Oscillospiraceae bacterium]
MTNINDGNALKSAMVKYLDEFPGDTICARQIWYEGLGGHGVPSPADMEAMHAVLDSLDGWKSAGDLRYEKFGVQYSYKRKKENAFVNKSASGGKPNRIMVQHMFKLNGLYRAPDGRVLKVVVSEVFNIRCFEVVDGKMVGSMIKFHPESEFAKSLVEVG